MDQDSEMVKQKLFAKNDDFYALIKSTILEMIDDMQILNEDFDKEMFIFFVNRLNELKVAVCNHSFFEGFITHAKFSSTPESKEYS
ncbi:MAG: hypothetical protein H6627_10745 [Calditrichae bacterium]|nr:hypothetical protein [Calditrichia bacterium]